MQKYSWKLPELEFEGNLVERLLKKRFGEKLNPDDFLNPKFNLDDPFKLPDMKKAVVRIKQAIANDEKIVIFGDYDVDGVTSCALMWELFKFLGTEVTVYIPDRFNEGYGLKESSLTNLFDGGTKLVITVDCGIRDVKLIKKMTEKGLDVIVTDHHDVADTIPECVAVVNPKRSISTYREKNLAGVGVAYGLCRALLVEMGVGEKEREWFEKWNLDLVAVGTVADMMDLTGENRIIVKYGLKVLSKTRKKGIKKLIEKSGGEIENIDTRMIGFALGPRLNAAGRMDHAMMSYNLLTENEDIELEIMVNNLEEHNRQRKNETDRILGEIFSRVNTDDLPVAIVENDKLWSKGVIGLVSSRVTEKYFRPSFLAQDEGEMMVGSARGIVHINVVKVLEQVSDILDHFGGHSMAGGFSLKKEKWDEFRSRVEKIVSQGLEGKDLHHVLEIDLEAEIDEYDDDLWYRWPQLEPFGLGNEVPKLVTKNVEIVKNSLIGKMSNHIKLFVRKNGNYSNVLWWNSADYADRINVGARYDIVYNLNFNEYKGKRSIDLMLLDIREK